MIQIYYGDGKGKTTAALGAGMRAKGAGMSVLLVQFLKNNKSSELSVLPFDIFKAPDNLPFNPDNTYQSWADSAFNYIKNSTADMVILDEFLDIVGRFISAENAAYLIENTDGEVIITGHKKIEELFDMADYITYFEKIRHPFDVGTSARTGIEY